MRKFPLRPERKTVAELFDEAFRCRDELGVGYTELESLAVHYAFARGEATRSMFLTTEREVDDSIIQTWAEEWSPKFAKKQGPPWVGDWSQIEKLEPFSPRHDMGHGPGFERVEERRRDYGLDMRVIFAAFGHLPALMEARDTAEREHWLNISKQLINAFRRTLPLRAETEDDWHFDVWSGDERLFRIAARRIFEVSEAERTVLSGPILSLPPAAHHHVTQFLNAILIESVRSDPPRIAELIPIWKEIAETFDQSAAWKVSSRNTRDVWKIVLLYGTPFDFVGESFFAPLVHEIRGVYESHVKRMHLDPYEQAFFVRFITTKAGEQLLVDAFIWLKEGWEKAGNYFWREANDGSSFEALMAYAWQHQRAAVRANAAAYKAFRVLARNLAARHVWKAVEIQQIIGTEVGER